MAGSGLAPVDTRPAQAHNRGRASLAVTLYVLLTILAGAALSAVTAAVTPLDT